MSKNYLIFKESSRLALVLGMIVWLAFPPMMRADVQDDLGEAVKTVMRTSIHKRGAVFAQHNKSIFYEQPNGKHYAFLEFHERVGTRCTLNFDRKWHYEVGFHIYFLNIPPAAREKMSVQLMKDPRSELDYEIGRPLKHGDALELGRRDDSYFNQINFTAADIIREYPYAVIALIEDGLDTAAVARRITFAEPFQARPRF